MAITRGMKLFAAAAAICVATSISARAEDGWIVKTSAASVAETADKLVAAVENAGAKVFARVDHAAGARSIDSDLADMTLVMFGNPKNRNADPASRPFSRS